MRAPDAGRFPVRQWAVGWALLCCCGLVACGEGSDSARVVAERFLDAHYVRIDLREARGYTRGLARKKIDEEAELTRGHVVDETARMPGVRYELVQERDRGERVVSFVYAATFLVPEADAMHRRLQLTVRREGPDWRVTNYEEY